MITEGDLKSSRAIWATAKLWRWPSLNVMTMVLWSSAAGRAVAKVLARAMRSVVAVATPSDLVRVRIVPPGRGDVQRRPQKMIRVTVENCSIDPTLGQVSLRG